METVDIPIERGATIVIFVDGFVDQQVVASRESTRTFYSKGSHERPPVLGTKTDELFRSGAFRGVSAVPLLIRRVGMVCSVGSRRLPRFSGLTARVQRSQRPEPS